MKSKLVIFFFGLLPMISSLWLCIKHFTRRHFFKLQIYFIYYNFFFLAFALDNIFECERTLIRRYTFMVNTSTYFTYFVDFILFLVFHKIMKDKYMPLFRYDFRHKYFVSYRQRLSVFNLRYSIFCRPSIFKTKEDIILVIHLPLSVYL